MLLVNLPGLLYLDTRKFSVNDFTRTMEFKINNKGKTKNLFILNNFI